MLKQLFFDTIGDMSAANGQKIVTRMAPSPTGNFHIGGVRTALFNYLFARQNGGTFILRSEDTDKERSKKEYEDQVLEIFKWLGLDYDHFFRQSDRTDIYVAAVEKLISNGHAYRGEGSKDNPDEPVIRFKNPNTTITFTDLLLGEVSVDTTDLGDFVIARDIKSPLYHLSVVVDDGEMGVTHVIRGQEHLANTPRQILLLEALGYQRPNYMHIPLILSPRGGKLSKRDPEVVPVLEYRDQGFLSDALLNFLSLLGWNPGTDEEIFTKNDLLKIFSLEKVHKSPGVFNAEKLLWINKQHIKTLSDDVIEKTILEFLPDTIKNLPQFSEDRFRRTIPTLVERITHFGELKKFAAEGELDYFFDTPQYDAQQLIWKNDTAENTIQHLEHVSKIISQLPETNNAEAWKEKIFPYADEKGRGNVLWPLRFALSGKDKSPDPFTLLGILGNDEAQTRITTAIEKLRA